MFLQLDAKYAGDLRNKFMYLSLTFLLILCNDAVEKLLIQCYTVLFMYIDSKV